MSNYSSCNQIAKDLTNALIVEKAFSLGYDNDNDCVITLDAEQNGTSIECRKHFNGLISVPQLDALVAATQEDHWNELFPNDNQRVVHPKNNISKDLPSLTKHFWSKGKNILLWNFDLFSTFYTYPMQLVETIANIPQIALSNTSGSLLAFTFVAIPAGDFLSKLKNCEQWKERLYQFREMKKMKKKEIMDHYSKEMKKLWTDKLLPCTKVQPVEIDLNRMQGEDRIYWRNNALLYKGETDNESTMCLLLYRGYHDANCHIDHKMPVEPKESGNSKKRTHTMVEAEEKILLDLDSAKPIEKRARTEQSETEFDGMSTTDESDLEDEIGSQSDGEESVFSVTSGESASVSEEDDEYNESDALLSQSDGEESIFSVTSGESASVSEEDDEYNESDVLLSDTDSESEQSETSKDTGKDSGYSSEGAKTGYEDLCDCELYGHQIEMMRAVRDHDRGYVNAICGCGKSLPMCRSCLNYKVSVIFVPFKVLVEQFYEKYFKNLSEVTVHKVNSEYVGNVIPPKEKETTVYIANYDSLHRLVQLGIVFDVIHWDEAHLATSAKRRGKIEKMAGEQNEALDMENVATIQARKNIFWTATPNKVMKSHPEIYGEEIFHYDFSTAVNDKVIKSFGIYISCNKGDDGEDDERTKFEKIVSTTCDFIRNEERKRILIYVNRVTETDSTYLTVEYMKRRKDLFDSSFRMDFISAKTKLKDRKKVFSRFSQSDDAIHVLVSCRTISVGVDLPTCDAVVFADTTNNITEIVQRGCRPLRLNDEERRTGVYEKSKILFPIYVSATEVRDMAKRNEKIHQAIRGNPLEIPMLVLNMLKDGLDVDFEFQRNGCHTGDEEEDAESRTENDNRADEEVDDHVRTNSIHRQSVNVELSFPFSDYTWQESSEDFAQSLHNLCVSLKKEPCAIEGWKDMSESEKAAYIADWSDENGGQRPNKQGGKEKDPVQKVMATWLSNRLHKAGYETCMTDDYATLRRHAWWNKAVENLLQEKECIIEGWDDMNEVEQTEYIADWSDENGRQRPKHKEKDPVQKVMATWLSSRLRKGRNSYKRCMKNEYASLRRHAWWNKAVENLLQEKECAIEGWDDMNEVEQAEYIADWSDENGGQRPKHKEKDPVQKVMANWLSRRLKRGKRGYARCMTDDYAALRRHAWWNEAVGSLLHEKEPCAIEGWDDMNEVEQTAYIAAWSDQNRGQRPKNEGGKEKDPVQKVMASWLSNRLIKGRKGYERCMRDDYASLRRHAWWNEAVGSLLQKKACVIEGWKDMSESEKAAYIADWSDENGGQRPNKQGGKETDPVQKFMATWLSNRLHKAGYETCMTDDYATLRRHAWWNKAVENLMQDKEPCAIEGWKEMAKSEKAAYIADWSDENGGQRPKHEGGKEKDPVQKFMATWLSNRLQKGSYEVCMTDDYATLRRHAWWNKAVENLLQLCDIEGWDDMNEGEQAAYIADWSDENGGQRPKHGGGKEKDPVQKVMASWLSNRLKKGRKGYERCMRDDYVSLWRHAWWNKAVENLLQKKACVIEGWKDMTESEKADYIADWSDENGGQRPKHEEKDPVQKVMATWLSNRLTRGKRGYEKCIRDDYGTLRRHAWWNEAVENLLQDKPCAIEGWKEMAKSEKAAYIADWSDENGGQRPKYEEKDPVQNVMATWLSNRLTRGKRGYEKCIRDDYVALRRHAWWNEAVENLLQDKEPCAIEGWKEMAKSEKAAYIADWSDENEGQRPKHEDPVQKVMATWLSNRLRRGKRGYERCIRDDYAALRRHAWWNEAVKRLL